MDERMDDAEWMAEDPEQDLDEDESMPAVLEPADEELPPTVPPTPIDEELMPVAPPPPPAPSRAELYRAFVPATMSRDRVAALSYDAAVRLVGRGRRRAHPEELRDLDMTDEEIAGIVQDYARNIETSEDRQNWLLAQILEEQQRQSRYLRGVRTFLLVLTVVLLLAIVTSCSLIFLQVPNLVR
jgi:hypothetical protein